jgi:hypothetical protein
MSDVVSLAAPHPARDDASRTHATSDRENHDFIPTPKPGPFYTFFQCFLTRGANIKIRSGIENGRQLGSTCSQVKTGLRMGHFIGSGAVSFLFIWGAVTAAPAAWAADPVMAAATGVSTAQPALPYSNQWAFESPGTSLAAGVTFSSLARDSLDVGIYRATADSRSLLSPLLQFKTRFGGNLLPHSRILKSFSLWGRYSLGLAVKQTKLETPRFTLSGASNTGYLAVATVRAGLEAQAKLVDFAALFVGAQATGYGYRHSASVGGAELQGLGWGAGPLGGLQFEIPTAPRLLLSAEADYDIPLSKSRPVQLREGFTFGAVVGMLL